MLAVKTAGAQSADFLGTSERSDQPAASAAPAVSGQDGDGGESDSSEAGILPDSPLYSLSVLLEKIAAFFTFQPADKAEKYVDLAARKVEELKALVEAGKATEETVGDNVKTFQGYLEKALSYAEEMRKKGEDAGELLSSISAAAANYQDAMKDLYEKIPAPARTLMQNGLDSLNKAYQDVLSRIPEERQTQISGFFEFVKSKFSEFWNALAEKFAK